MMPSTPDEIDARIRRAHDFEVAELEAEIEAREADRLAVERRAGIVRYPSGPVAN